MRANYLSKIIGQKLKWLYIVNHNMRAMSNLFEGGKLPIEIKSTLGKVKIPLNLKTYECRF